MSRAAAARKMHGLLDMVAHASGLWQLPRWCRRRGSGLGGSGLSHSCVPPSQLRSAPVTAAAAAGPSGTGGSAAGGGSPQRRSRSRKQQPPPQQSPQQHQQGEHHAEYHTVSQSWHVPRTSVHHYPPAVQQRMRSGWGKQQQQPAPPPPQAQPPPPQANPAVEQLLAALNWEAGSGYSNGVGRTGERFAAWAAGRLRQFGAAQQQQLGGAAAPGLAERCASLAQELAGYDSLDAAGRALLTQRVRLAAEELLHGAQVQHKQQPPGGYSSSGSSSSSAGAALPPAAAAITQAVWRGQAMAGATGAAQPKLPRPPSREALALAVDPDAAAELAHEEETATNGAPHPGQLDDMSAGPAVPSKASEQALSEGEGSDGEAGPRRRSRAVSPATLGFRRSFAEAAAAFSEAARGPGVVAVAAGGEQRTTEWHRLRERRLTASAFSKALGFFTGDRPGLWEEKVGLREAFAGNAATAWGNRSEALALEDYSLNTGQDIEGCMFQVKHDDMAHGWLGASPDGLIGGLQIAMAAGAAGARPGPGAAAPPPPFVLPPGTAGAGVLSGPGPGILEIKCPFNKGRPEEAVPPKHAIWYYMPQVQGLMDIFDREWCNLYVWTPAGGSGLYHIPRDRRYWADCFAVLADFWWGHVVPARQARERHGAGAEDLPPLELLHQFRPAEASPATERLRQRSKEIAQAAQATFFPSRQRGA